MSEKLLILHCSPTLAGMKAGSMFSCAYRSAEELKDDIRHANHILVPKGLRVLPLCRKKDRALIYVFRPKAIEKVLEDERAVSVLEGQGYQDIRVSSCIARLMGRLKEEGEFPHEIGLFLGYPPEDVWGFIENKACGHKCVGCWKVYGDEAEAKKTFARYRKCTAVYCSLWEQGKSIERLTVAG